MNHYASDWIDDWCKDNGWTDWFVDRSIYWGFPPQAVMPLPIPPQAMRAIKAKQGLCLWEKVWYGVAAGSAIAAAVSSYLLSCPMPLVGAFAFCAVVVARLEDEDF
jgi:hypothetical protein